MSKKIVLSAKIDYLINYAKQQYSKSRGLHLNSADWKPFITIGTPQYYSFILNGTIKFYTKSMISGERYDQLLKLTDFKKLEAPLLLLFLIGHNEKTITEFISLLLSHGEAKLFCPCKSYQFWGPHYNLTKIRSAYGPGEIRPPDKRDPNHQNLVCKHLWVILDSYSKMINSFAAGLLPYYKRLFGLTSPTGIKRLQKTLGRTGFKKVIEQAIINLNKINNVQIISKFKQLTDNKLNEVLKPKENIEPLPEFETIDKSKPEEKMEEPEAKLEETSEVKKITPNDMEKIIDEEKGNEEML